MATSQLKKSVTTNFLSVASARFSKKNEREAEQHKSPRPSSLNPPGTIVTNGGQRFGDSKRFGYSLYSCSIHSRVLVLTGNEKQEKLLLDLLTEISEEGSSGARFTVQAPETAQALLRRVTTCRLNRRELGEVSRLLQAASHATVLVVSLLEWQVIWLPKVKELELILHSLSIAYSETDIGDTKMRFALYRQSILMKLKLLREFMRCLRELRRPSVTKFILLLPISLKFDETSAQVCEFSRDVDTNIIKHLSARLGDDFTVIFTDLGRSTESQLKTLLRQSLGPSL